ncbi:unnamed protein product [Adineta steineri]|uniref:Uncharacterized protein n=1 Tax=Adineta steineri TaxID=433720 RepID=A0A814TKW1_9BILA|nr:unnamed protein product [Adineta steineri]
MNSSMYQNDDNETAVQPSLSAVADPTVWGHAFYGDAMACAASAAACTGHKRPMELCGRVTRPGMPRP